MPAMHSTRAHATTLAIAVAVLLVLDATPAGAQRTVAHDTLSDATPVAVTCGFCAGEAIGVVFRELPTPLRGIDPGDFPLELRSVQIALASARTTGTAGAYACEGVLAGGTVLVPVEIWAGTTPPTGDIRTRPLGDAWDATETLVWASDEVPIELSVPDAEGSARFTLTLNTIDLEDEAGAPIVVAAPATYLRVVVLLPTGGSSTSCDALSLDPPAAVAVRDDDRRIADERSFLYAAGFGFVWNEDAPSEGGGGAEPGIAGDWAIRLQIVPSAATPIDAGTSPPTDADADADAGAIDVDAALADGGEPIDARGGGCSCGATSPARGAHAGTAIALAVIAWAGARRRR
jgi:MYXO-CTERM domain-containing protein